jgi:tRNA-specific 2-thiouridylase
MVRVVCGMSGGVDSSLSAALLREQGYDVVGVTMKLWPCAACCSPTETIDARAVALTAGVPHYVVDMEDAFRRDVVAGFVASYAAAQTPNPCVRCNEKIKFGALWSYARELGASQVATGHYAQVAERDGRWCLHRSLDVAKDQTYFLFSLTQEQLAAAHFPVGGMTKEEVRQQSRQRGIVTADKHESQDICFIGAGGIGAFLRAEVPEAFRPGPIVHQDGTLLGEHQGLAAYTIGQRRGLQVAWHEPLFVVALDLLRNTVTLGPRDALLTSSQRLRDCTWHLGPLPRAGLVCRVRCRYRAAPVPARILPIVLADGAEGAEVRFETPTPRASPGQACVAYDETDIWCLGGGWCI